VQTTVINFISPDCPYCKEQMVILDSVREQVSQKTCRFINVTPFLKTELMQRSSAGIEWVEDKQGELRNLFKISVYPTLFVVGQDGKIVLIIPGVPDQLKTDLLTALANGG
jgi:thioredoxin-related protein